MTRLRIPNWKSVLTVGVASAVTALSLVFAAQPAEAKHGKKGWRHDSRTSWSGRSNFGHSKRWSKRGNWHRNNSRKNPRWHRDNGLHKGQRKHWDRDWDDRRDRTRSLLDLIR